MMTEVIGIIGTTLIGISFLSNNLKKIRIYNIIGSIIMIIYGILLNAYSMIILNLIVIIINIKKIKR
jgi:hypothetical protein